jgi:protein-S-isoprenylcysteine O-methyltransferase Ste14
LDLHAKNKAIPHVSNLSTLLEPNYTILTFLMIKTFFYIEFIGILSLIRILVSRGPSRWAAFAALSIALVGVAAKYVPPLAGLIGTDLGRVASWIVNQGVLQAGSGMALPLLVSILFALSWRLAGRRWWVLDALHLIAAICFFGLWYFTQL